MRIGVSTLTYLHLPYRDVLERLVPLQPAVVELFFDDPHFDLQQFSADDVRVLREFGEAHAIEYTLHAPCFDLNPASANAGARDECVRQSELAIYMAAQLGVAEVVVHSGMRSDPKIPLDQTLGWSIESLRRIARTAEQHRVRVSVENVGYGPAGFITRPEVLLDIVRKIDSGLIGITLDTGHAALQGFAIDAAIAAFGDNLTHVHLHNTQGRSDDHLTLEHGVIAFEPIFRQLVTGAYSGYLIIESCDLDHPDAMLRRDLDFVHRGLAKARSVHVHCAS
jgi:sugar phosphate isomerase/epimerase